MKRNIAYASLTALLLSGVASLSLAAEPDTKLLGDPVPDSAVQQHTVVITPSTTHVNVTGGDVVKFVVGDKSFTWDFDTSGNQMAFDLERIAPAGALDHKVTVYVARDPTYNGGA